MSQRTRSSLLALVLLGMLAGCASPEPADVPAGSMPERRVNEIQKDKNSDSVSGVSKAETDN